MTIRDVIHGDIKVENELIIQLIETKEFQRLRNIKQLGLTYIIYPTTEHSRYMHSLGVYHLAKKMVNVLYQKHKFNEEDIFALVIASLLHDLGHGPFSHTSEEFFKFDHEQKTVEIILNEKTQINQVLKKYKDQKFIDKIVSFIKKEHNDPILNKVLSNTIDVDRMDYLLRDSYFAGVSYGEVDIDRIFNVIDIENNQLVFLEKGTKTIEDFIMSRYNMFLQVYLNKKALCYEILVSNIFKRIKELVENNYEFKTDLKKLLPLLENNYSILEYLDTNDNVFLNIIEDLCYEDDEKIKYLASIFVNKQIKYNCPEEYCYKLTTKRYEKKIYNESIMIKRKNDIIKLEELSPLTNFIKNDIKIEQDAIEFYV